jgi:hypothetical protein
MNGSRFIALTLVLGFSASPLAASSANYQDQSGHVSRVAWDNHDHDRDARRDHHQVRREELHRDHRQEALRHGEREHRLHADEHRRDDHWRHEREHEKHLPPGQAKKLSEHRDHGHHGA